MLLIKKLTLDRKICRLRIGRRLVGSRALSSGTIFFFNSPTFFFNSPTF